MGIYTGYLNASGIPNSTNLLDPSYVTGIYFKGESLNMASERSWDELTDIVEDHCGENVVMVTHGGIIQVALTHVYGLPVTQYRTFTVPTASLLEFEPNSSVTVLSDW
ncbi:MAG: hypothetical protein MPEBLZ_04166 [Candidatus Methanoperedens nitroreducens]|uniref:Phosphoglycerate mutase n=1 Tax=Candidatus Methanoperedens nitratireducens TaxID=1392998 RepID=A0A0P8C3Z5_9EURY|nr:MAG: hypothetical protein MPEBLZ_04166 [Candidatus Methanoperedens sp. BLZ1]CAG0968485.1 hypothetical protein METP2_01246 [Methanosarcinales archaeon]